MKHLIVLLTGTVLLGLTACIQPEASSTTTTAPAAVEEAAPAVEAVPQSATETESTENTTTPVEEQPAAEEAAPVEQAAETEAVETSENAPEIELVPAEDIDWLMVTSRIDYDLSLLGNPDAPVTMIEYSDFM